MNTRRLSASLRELGLWNGVLYACDRALNTISLGRARLIRYLIVVQPLAGESAIPGGRPTAIQVREVSPEDPVTVDFPRPPRIVNARFGSGARCFVAEHRGRFAGHIWLASPAYDEDEVRCRFELDEPQLSAWDFDVYVEPEYRMGRTFQQLWCQVNRELASNGLRWSFSRISAFNPASLSAHRRLGARIIGTTTFVRFGQLEIMLSGLPPYGHVGWSPGSRPVIRLRVPDASG